MRGVRNPLPKQEPARGIAQKFRENSRKLQEEATKYCNKNLPKLDLQTHDGDFEKMQSAYEEKKSEVDKKMKSFSIRWGKMSAKCRGLTYYGINSHVHPAWGTSWERNKDKVRSWKSQHEKEIQAARKRHETFSAKSPYKKFDEKYSGFKKSLQAFLRPSSRWLSDLPDLAPQKMQSAYNTESNNMDVKVAVFEKQFEEVTKFADGKYETEVQDATNRLSDVQQKVKAWKERQEKAIVEAKATFLQKKIDDAKAAFLKKCSLFQVHADSILDMCLDSVYFSVHSSGSYERQRKDIQSEVAALERKYNKLTEDVAKENVNAVQVAIELLKTVYKEVREWTSRQEQAIDEKKIRDLTKLAGVTGTN